MSKRRNEDPCVKYHFFKSWNSHYYSLPKTLLCVDLNLCFKVVGVRNQGWETDRPPFSLNSWSRYHVTPGTPSKIRGTGRTWGERGRCVLIFFRKKLLKWWPDHSRGNIGVFRSSAWREDLSQYSKGTRGRVGSVSDVISTVGKYPLLVSLLLSKLRSVSWNMCVTCGVLSVFWTTFGATLPVVLPFWSDPAGWNRSRSDPILEWRSHGNKRDFSLHTGILPVKSFNYLLLSTLKSQHH